MASTTEKPVDTSSTEANPWRKEVEQSLQAAKQVISKSLSPLPELRVEPRNDNNQELTGLLSDLRHLGFKDVETLLSLFNSEVKGVQDDNKFLLENLVQTLSKLSINSKVSHQLTAGFVNNLWNSLPHPPLTMLGEKYKYREADGSYNNIRCPQLGAANTPYARSAEPSVLQNIALPDPGMIFDTLMARGDTFKPHPNKISSMLFYLATIIIHDIFRTDHNDFNNSMTSSYLDLAPLYGSNQEEQNTVRSFKDGKLKPDCFSEKRLLGFPPGVGVFVIMFNRFHNFVVTQLALINENRRFTKPKDDATKEAWAKYDNDLFQTGRLITCGLYVNCILKDYVRTILSLNRANTKWDLDPRAEENKTLFNNPAAQGTGNQVSAEFNLIYRWHSAVSEKDDKWTQEVYSKMFPGKDPEDVTLPELLGALRAMEKNMPEDPQQRPFANLKRQVDGTFPDDDLVTILSESVSDVAGSFGANRVPKILKSVEILGIIQSRSWNMASLNEFRQFAGLTKHETFEDINPDPEVAQKLKNLYDHPDYVELYPGLVAEKSKPPMAPGSGLCVNFTTSYAILSDAVGLVRGDRFYTLDYTPKNLTNWGFNEVQYDVNVDDGCVLYKLILRAFPNHFEDNSVFAHYPLVVPEENLIIMKGLGTASKYTWAKPARKSYPIMIKTPATAKQILDDKENWKVTWGAAIQSLASSSKQKFGHDYAFAGDLPPNESSRNLVGKALYPKNWQYDVKSFYTTTTKKLLGMYGYSIPRPHKSKAKTTYQVDIVRDIANLVNTRFAASVFSLPLKTEEHPRGIYTEQELYQVLSLLSIAIFGNYDNAKSFQIREAAHVLAQQLGELVLVNTEAVAATGVLSDILAKLHSHPGELSDYGIHTLQRFLESGLPIKEVVFSQLLPTAASMAASQAQMFSIALDYYLGDGAEHLPALYTLAKDSSDASDEKLLRYYMEAVRLRGTMVLPRKYSPSGATKDSTTTVTEGSNTYTIKLNTEVHLNFPLATVDAASQKVDLTRSMDEYTFHGHGPHECLGKDINMTAMTTMFKVVFGLKNLRRAQGSAPGGRWYGESQGEMKSVNIGGLNVFMTPDQSSYFPFPTTMKVQWDSDD
ncbi:putative fatty acid oxygenase PpoA [Halenospora varia]|nr:putative fatty acid oxygenase PpoA [Halenospora varia]